MPLSQRGCPQWSPSILEQHRKEAGPCTPSNHPHRSDVGAFLSLSARNFLLLVLICSEELQNWFLASFIYCISEDCNIPATPPARTTRLLPAPITVDPWLASSPWSFQEATGDIPANFPATAHSCCSPNSPRDFTIHFLWPLLGFQEGFFFKRNFQFPLEN